MDREIIDRVEVLDTGELLLGIKGQGKPMYQYVYREAAGVYWDASRRGFKSTPMRDWSCSRWFKQIVEVARSGLDVELRLGIDVSWHNIPEQQQEEIKQTWLISA